jgi:hypothetical protein
LEYKMLKILNEKKESFYDGGDNWKKVNSNKILNT